MRKEEGGRQRGTKETEQQAKRITIFSPFVFVPRNTFCCHNSPQGRGPRNRGKRPQVHTERGGGGAKEGKSRANRARILRGAQCGVSGPSNACKQSQKTTMMMELGTREIQADRETERMRIRRRRHGNNIAAALFLSLSLSLCLPVCGGRTACNGNGNKNNNKNRNECECEYQQTSQTE